MASGLTAKKVFKRLGAFALAVIKQFRANQGVLLAGAVAYYTLLSLVPLLILISMALRISFRKTACACSAHLRILHGPDGPAVNNKLRSCAPAILNAARRVPRVGRGRNLKLIPVVTSVHEPRRRKT